ncbi:M28 family peptidase [Polymorphobacter sp.]|uniref:M28 family peptidase n=1 Tax=Polymorphobacter sp. TaxID=1909290 RepID=UPI003F6EF4B3
MNNSSRIAPLALAFGLIAAPVASQTPTPAPAAPVTVASQPPSPAAAAAALRTPAPAPVASRTPAPALPVAPGSTRGPRTDRLPAALEGHVRFLADDLLEGRGIGERGHEIAARYIAAQFAGLGLVPAGNSAAPDGWFQRITFAERRFTSAQESIAFAPAGTPAGTGAGKTQTWINGKDIMLSPGNTEGSDEITAPLVFAGFGLYDPALGIDDFAGLDIKGKIVVVITGAHPGLPSETAAHLSRSSKASRALALGAIGLVQVRSYAEQARAPFAKAAPRARLPVRGPLGPNGAPVGDGAALQVRATLDDAAAAALFAAGPQPLVTLLDAARTAPVKGFALPGTFTIRRAQAITRITSPNVLGLLPGRGPRAQEIVLVSAHADHLGRKPDAKPGEDAIYTGAMDNAGGIATLLETARTLAAGPPPPRSILFLATTAEESGLLGADYWSRYPTLPIASVVGVVNIDMPILTCDFADVIAFGAEHSTLIDPVRAAARKEKLTVSPDPQPEEAIFTRSDHYPLVRAGIPAVFLKTGDKDTSGGQRCAETERTFRLNHYHEVSDDLSQPFDWQAAAKFARLNTDIIRRIAAGPIPRWFEGDYFGNAFAPQAPKAKK